MSKKKTKAGKQKQKKAKASVTKKRKQIASKYNVPLLNAENVGRHKNHNTKAGRHATQRDGANLDSNNDAALYDGIQTPFNSPKNASSSSGGDTLMNDNDVATSTTIVNMTHRNKQKIDQQFKVKAQSIAMKRASKKEQKEFEKEYQSLHERTMYQQWKEQQQQQQQQHQRSNGKKHTKEQTGSTNNDNDASQNSIIQLAKPIFDIYRKPTTDELVHQTTNQLNQQNLIQQPQHNNQCSDNTSNHESINFTNATETTDNRTLLQQLAAKKRDEMRMNQLYNNQNNSVDDQEKFKNNSFWAFQDDDEDDDDEDRKETTATIQSKPTKTPSPYFQFAAPSFAVPSTNTSINQNQTVSSAVDDPDL